MLSTHLLQKLLVFFYSVQLRCALLTLKIHFTDCLKFLWQKRIYTRFVTICMLLKRRPSFALGFEFKFISVSLFFQFHVHKYLCLACKYLCETFL